ncbi:MAG: hypothetical protein A2Z14_06605 [Chloroflexi bacterium RBG_16_48_8]|nr:MAG: hypothetical protein A2Z14_06605 [Chloroflexi bacterium RBG_16_48_8]
MEVPCVDSLNTAGQTLNVYRCETVLIGPITQALVVIEALALDTAALGQCTGVGFAGGDGDRFFSQTNDFHGGETIFCGAISQLPVEVVSPAFADAAVCHSTGVSLAGRKIKDISLQLKHIDWHSAVVRCPIAQLTGGVVAPAFYVSLLRYDAGVGDTRCNGCDIFDWV